MSNTVANYMAKVTAAEATGEYVGRDMVLGLDCSANGNLTDPEQFTYVGAHIEDYGAKLSASSEDKSYVYEGDSTLKTSTQRTFAITGQRLISDEFQDFVNSFAIKFGKGSAVQRNYVYFHSGTKQGEKGTMTILVNNDGNGAASSPADIDVELKSSGPVEEYTYGGKKTPVGTPTFTAINTSGKTLADANLGLGSIKPSGTIAWDDGDTTTVIANQEYGWTFTPTDANTYTGLTGTITPYTTV